MKTALSTLLLAISLTGFASQAQANDRCHDDERRYYRYDRSCEQRETYRYERPRYYSEEEVVIQPRQYVVRGDEDCHPPFRHHSHHDFLRFFFGGR